MNQLLQNCVICPRKCGADRTARAGFCGAGERIEVSKIMLHLWEEPCISGSDPARGSGAVFFTHCPLGCVYCQNRGISRRTCVGDVFTIEDLAEAFLRLQRDGAYNLNLVSPTQYTPQLIGAVALARKNGLTLPVVWNTGGYELPETIEALRGTVNVFLTDFKYASPEVAGRYSAAPDYPETAARSLAKMYELTGACEFAPDVMMTRGVIIRHLILPGHRADSIAVLRKIAELVPAANVRLSLMAQYTPEFLDPVEKYKKINRKITSFEYETVLEEANRLGFDGYSQERGAATKNYTPEF
ncbi:MAG: radical SAM protein [Eubacteriales bacterium]